MGLFKSIKKAFKKVVKGVKKVVKKVVKGVKKVAKKIGSSKILKALAIAAAVIVTGGAAIGAFTGGTAASGTFAGWMMNASQAVTGFTVGGVNVGAIMKPFASVGKTLGNVAAGVTDFTGLTTEASRTGSVQASTISGKPFGIESTATEGAVSSGTQLTTEQILAGETPASIARASQMPSAQGALNLPSTLPSSVPGATTVSGYQLNIPTTIPGATGVSAGAGVTEQLAVNVPKVLNEAGEIVQPTVTEPTRFVDTNVGNFVSTVGTSVATNVFTGAAMQSIVGDPEMTGALGGSGRQEGASNFDPLRIYAATNGIDVGSIYNQPLYGNSDPSSVYGNELFKQQTVEVV
tara:strand:- start:4867 stop:5913 length:1047 start_codon:yes stop_codon:yes gene_type:complete